MREVTGSMAGRAPWWRLRPGQEAGWFALMLAVAAALVGSFWFRVGLDIYPLDDGWTFLGPDAGRFAWDDFFFGLHRVLRLVPYQFAAALEPDGFRLLNAQLIGLGALSMTGLFLLTRRLLGGRVLPAFLVAGLTILFPNDPTMFWLGAFGVNISYCLMVWASYVGVCAIDRRSLALALPGWAMLYAGART